MCKEIDKLVEKKVEEAEVATSKEIALRMHEDGLDDNRIARYTNTPVEQVKTWLW